MTFDQILSWLIIPGAATAVLCAAGLWYAGWISRH